jgi:hypothetical protein
MVRDKNNNDKLILGNIDSSPGTRSSNLCTRIQLKLVIE